jgi:hypothetical protein
LVGLPAGVDDEADVTEVVEGAKRSGPVGDRYDDPALTSALKATELDGTCVCNAIFFEGAVNAA